MKLLGRASVVVVLALVTALPLHAYIIIPAFR